MKIETSQNSSRFHFEVVLAIKTALEPQSYREEKINSSILKDSFSFWSDPSIFTLILHELSEQLQQNKLSFPSLRAKKVLPTPIQKSDSDIDANSSCCYKSEARFTAGYSRINIDSNIRDNIIKRIINELQKSLTDRIKLPIENCTKHSITEKKNDHICSLSPTFKSQRC